MHADFTRLADAMAARERVPLALREFDALVGWLSDADRPDVALLAELMRGCDELELRSVGLAWVDALLFDAHSGDFDPAIPGFRDAPFEDQLRRFRQLNALLHPDRHPQGSEWANSRAQAVNAVYRRFRREGPGSHVQAYPKHSGGSPAAKARPQQADAASPVGSAPPAEWLTRLRWWLAGRQHLPERIVAGFAVSGVVIMLLVLFAGPDDPFQTPSTAGQGDGYPTTVTVRESPKRSSDPAAAAPTEAAVEVEQAAQVRPIARIEPLESLPVTASNDEASRLGAAQAPAAAIELPPRSSVESVAHRIRSSRESEQPSWASSIGEQGDDVGNSPEVSAIVPDVAEISTALRPSSLWPRRTLLPLFVQSLREITERAEHARQEASFVAQGTASMREELPEPQLPRSIDPVAATAVSPLSVLQAEYDTDVLHELVGAQERLIAENPLSADEAPVEMDSQAPLDTSGQARLAAIEAAATVATRESAPDVLAMPSADQVEAGSASMLDLEAVVSNRSVADRTPVVSERASAPDQGARSSPSTEVLVSPNTESTPSEPVESAVSIAAVEPAQERPIPASDRVVDGGGVTVASNPQRLISSPNELLDEFAASFASGDRDEMFSLVTPDLRADPAPMLDWLGQSAESLFAPGLRRQMNLKPTGLHRASNALRYLVQYQLTYEQSGTRVRREGAVYVTVESVGSDDWRIASFSTP